MSTGNCSSPTGSTRRVFSPARDLAQNVEAESLSNLLSALHKAEAVENRLTNRFNCMLYVLSYITLIIAQQKLLRNFQTDVEGFYYTIHAMDGAVWPRSEKYGYGKNICIFASFVNKVRNRYIFVYK